MYRRHGCGFRVSKKDQVRLLLQEMNRERQRRRKREEKDKEEGREGDWNPTQ